MPFDINKHIKIIKNFHLKGHKNAVKITLYFFVHWEILKSRIPESWKHEETRSYSRHDASWSKNQGASTHHFSRNLWIPIKHGLQSEIIHLSRELFDNLWWISGTFAPKFFNNILNDLYACFRSFKNAKLWLLGPKPLINRHEKV